MAALVVGVSMEELSRRPEWRSVSPAVRRILSDALGGVTGWDLTGAVERFHRNFSPAKAAEVAENLLANPATRALMSARLGYEPKGARRLVVDAEEQREGEQE
jgi:hypothetical protein